MHIDSFADCHEVVTRLQVQVTE